MSDIKKQLRLDREEYFKVHLSIVNCFLPIKLTPMEIEVVSSFIALSGDIAKDRFGTTAKKIVREKLKISPAGMSNYIKTLRDKGFIISNSEKELDILPILFPEEKEQLYLFKLINIEA